MLGSIIHQPVKLILLKYLICQYDLPDGLAGCAIDAQALVDLDAENRFVIRHNIAAALAWSGPNVNDAIPIGTTNSLVDGFFLSISN